MSKQVLSIKQMKHLQELGLELKKDTILVWARFMLSKTQISDWGDWEIVYNHSAITENSQTIPAYTLQDVMNALTKRKINDGFCSRIIIDLSRRFISYHYKDKQYVKTVMKSFDSNRTGCLIDAAYELLCWAIGKKFVETNKK